MNRSVALGVVLASMAHIGGAPPAPAAAEALTVASAGRPALRAVRAGVEPRLDGRLDDPVWAEAEAATSFRQTDPDEGAPATQATEVRVLFDDDAIYVGARLAESDPRDIVARLSRRDLQVEADALEIALDTLHDRLTAAAFTVTASGSLRDATVRSDGVRDETWDPVWSAAVARDEGGWSAEIRIPVSQLRLARGGDGTWGIQITRFSSRRQETDVFAFTPKNEAQGVHRYGLLTGLSGLTPASSLELMPFLSSRVEYLSRGAGDPLREQGDLGAKVGLDARTRLGGNLRLDATVRPDFGQVEADPALVNLSGFETFYPEKRPFFVQGSDLFRFGDQRVHRKFNLGQPFHSRRIGRAPQGRVTDADAEWVDQPDETPIAAAVKVTGRIAQRWSVGVVDAVTERTDAGYVTSSGARANAPVEPAANYFVARARRESAAGTTVVGGTLTAVHRRLTDPSLRTLLRERALHAGADLNHAWANRRWALDIAVQATSLRGSAAAIDRAQRSVVLYAQRPDRRRPIYDPNRTGMTGHQAQVGLTKLSGLHWLGSVALQQSSPGFEPNDVGFIPRADMRTLTTYLAYKEDKPGPIFRKLTLSAVTRDAWTYDGVLAYAPRGVGARTQLLNYWTVNLDLTRFTEVHDDRLSRGGPLVFTPSASYVVLSAASDARKSWLVGGTLSRLWNRRGTDELVASTYAEYRPSAAVRVRIEPEVQRIRRYAEFVASVGDPAAARTYGRRTIFMPLAQHSLSLIGRVDWTLTPSLSLQLFAQPFLSSGAYGAPMELRRGDSYDFGRYGRDLGTASRDANQDWAVDPDGAGPAPSFTVADPTFGVRSLLGNLVLRWEYRPGSTLYFVWQQTRDAENGEGSFSAPRGLRDIFGTRPDQVFLLKASWWFQP